MSIVLEDTNCCANQYMCALDIYQMDVLSYSYGNIIDIVINTPGRGNNAVDGLNETDKRYLK